jgi:hypothetical protein
MSDRRELRQDISEKAAAVLDAESYRTGQTKQDIVRKILDDWADRKIHEASIVMRFAGVYGKPRSEAE